MDWSGLNRRPVLRPVSRGMVQTTMLAPSTGRHNSDGCSNLRVHGQEHSPRIGLSKPQTHPNREKTRTDPGSKEIANGISETGSEVLKERLCSQHEPLAGDEVEALHMDLLGVSLDIQDTHARAHLVVPAMNQRILIAGKLIEFLECG